jgi:hypothetical protein
VPDLRQLSLPRCTCPSGWYDQGKIHLSYCSLAGTVTTTNTIEVSGTTGYPKQLSQPVHVPPHEHEAIFIELMKVNEKLDRITKALSKYIVEAHNGKAR